MLLIFGPGIDFQVGQEMGGVDIFLDFSKSLFTGFSIVHDTNIFGHFKTWDQFLGTAGSGWEESTFFSIFEIFFTWAFQQYMTTPYIMVGASQFFLGLKTLPEWWVTTV